MWRTLVRPDCLFLLGMGQALLPYAIWAFGGGVADARVNAGYMPIPIWLAAYAAFWIGCRLISGKTSASADFDLRPYSKRIVVASVITTLVLLGQIAWAISSYGTLPLLSYIASDGKMDVATANETQESAGFGQFGLLIVSTYVANGVMLLLLLVNGQEKRRRFSVFGSLLLVLLLADLLNGKRQGLLIAAVYVCVGLLIYAGSLRRALASVSIIPQNRFFRSVILCGGILLGIYLMGKLAEIRTQGADNISGIDETIRYLEFPILNLSAQCEQAGGFGPYAFSLRYPLQHLLPFKLIDSWLSEDIPSPERIERTSPSGMFELIHWAWGIFGVVGYALFLGALCTYVYRKATRDIRYFLMYPLFAYALFTAHSYNHFLNLTFVPMPALLFWGFTKRLLTSKRRTSSTGNCKKYALSEALL